MDQTAASVNTHHPRPAKRARTDTDIISSLKPDSASEIARVPSKWGNWSWGVGIPPGTLDAKQDLVTWPDTVNPVATMLGKDIAPRNLKIMSAAARKEISSKISPSDISTLDALFREVDHAPTSFDVNQDIANQLLSYLPEVLCLVQALEAPLLWVVPPCDAEWRLPVDAFLSECFKSTPRTEYRLGFEIALARSARIPTPDVATLDSVVIFYATEWARSALPDSRRYTLEASCTFDEIVGSIPVVQLVIEYQKGVNQLLYGLVTALMQRLAMGITDHPVYGVVVNKSTATIWAAWVVSHTTTGAPPIISTKSVAVLNLCEPLRAIQFAAFLLTIKNDLLEKKRAQFNALTVDDLKAAQANRRSWKTPTTPSGDSLSGESQASSSQASRNSGQADAEILNPAFWADQSPEVAILVDSDDVNCEDEGEEEEDEEEEMPAEDADRPDVKAWAEQVSSSQDASGR